MHSGRMAHCKKKFHSGKTEIVCALANKPYCTIVSTIYLDVTRLVTRLYDGLLPTGVDRVGLAYIQRYGAHARAVLSERGFSTVLTEKDSQQTFSWLTSSIRKRNEIRKLVLRASLNRTREASFHKGVLLHTSHNGMEYPRYYRAMEKRNLKTVF